VGGNSIVSSSKIMSTESVEEIASDSEDIDKSNIKENEELFENIMSVFRTYSKTFYKDKASGLDKPLICFMASSILS
ncbi:MAG: hypothetical protein E6Y39_10215, partial [Clostridium butyricum]|nr:hypothetical protein [Clostridium butyricum]